jgi:hypothetical protein
MFEITIKPKKFKSHEVWHSKMQGVVLVEKGEYIDILWKLFCEQDDYWENYKDLIKVAPKEIDSEEGLKRLCEYCGKTDIYDFDDLKSKALEKGVDFKLYQFNENDCYYV